MDAQQKQADPLFPRPEKLKSLLSNGFGLSTGVAVPLSHKGTAAYIAVALSL